MKYQLNDCGVCTNPEIVFCSEAHGLAWNYIQIELASWNGKWDYGLCYCGGATPCCPKLGKYQSREDALNSAISYLLDREKRSEGLLNGAMRQKPYDDFHRWLESRNQLALF